MAFGYTARRASQVMAQQRALRQQQAFAPFGAPSPGVTGGMQSLVEQYNRAYQQALQRSRQHYRQMLGTVEQTTGQRAADIRTAYGQQQSQMMQQLARQGMAGTTIAPTMQMGIARERESSLNRLADLMQQTKLGVMQQKQIQYPAPIESIIAGVGQYYGGGGLPMMLQALAGLKR